MSSGRANSVSITVSDPVRHGDSLNAFVTYKVTSETELHKKTYVHRRYKDFEWLQELLADLYPGLFIPPLPEKNVIKRFDDPFLAQRQRALDKFLKRVAAHEQLREDRYFKAFLELENLESTKESAKQVKKKDQSIWEWAAAATSSFSTKMTGGTYTKEKTEQDEKFDEIKQYVSSLEPQMSAVSKHTHSLVEKNKDLAQSLFDFGVAFTLLAQAEQDTLGEAMRQLGQCADKLSRLTSVEADKETEFLDEPLKDYVRMVKQVKAALDVRTSKLQSFEAALGELESKKTSREKLNSLANVDPSARAQKIATAEEEVRKAKDRADRAEDDYNLTTDRVFAEMDRFKREKLIDFKTIILNYVQLQIEYNHQVEESWRGCLPALQALSLQHQQSAASPLPATSSAMIDSWSRPALKPGHDQVSTQGEEDSAVETLKGKDSDQEISESLDESLGSAHVTEGGARGGEDSKVAPPKPPLNMKSETNHPDKSALHHSIEEDDEEEAFV